MNKMRKKISHLVQKFDFGYFLPIIARLPLGLGKRLAVFRGFVCFLFDYGWKSEALGYKYIRKNVLKMMKHLYPHRSNLYHRYLTLRRFCYESREEWQALLLQKPVMEKIFATSTFQDKTEIENLYTDKRGLVLVTAHIDSYTMGMVLLGMKGMKVNVLIADLFGEEIIHEAVRKHYISKYASMDDLMNGKSLDPTLHMEYFYSALTKGETVCLVSDIPGTKSTVQIPFAGKKFQIPLGAFHLAKKTGSKLAAFVCLYIGPGKYKTVLLPPVEIFPDNPEKTLRPVYKFLESWISKYPDRWMAAELFANFPDNNE
jgi:lauroyl/myristoyl acyltransferase